MLSNSFWLFSVNETQIVPFNPQNAEVRAYSTRFGSKHFPGVEKKLFLEHRGPVPGPVRHCCEEWLETSLCS